MARNAVQVVVGELDRFIDDVMKKLALDLVAILSSAPSEGGTPIDTGWASANWIPYIGAPRSAPAGSRPNNAAHGANNASRFAQEAGSALVGTTFKHGTPMGVSNAVPYIVELNDVPTSKQAPRGFVQTAIHRTVREFRKKLRDANRSHGRFGDLDSGSEF